MLARGVAKSNGEAFSRHEHVLLFEESKPVLIVEVAPDEGVLRANLTLEEARVLLLLENHHTIVLRSEHRTFDSDTDECTGSL